MKNYEITVNGKVYAVTVKEVDEATFNASQSESVQENKQNVQTTGTAAGKGIEVTAPMPGSIIDVAVQVGTAVKAGQLLCVLEAMKMENSIVAPEDGTVSEVLVSKGAQVEAGEILVKL